MAGVELRYKQAFFKGKEEELDEVEADTINDAPLAADDLAEVKVELNDYDHSHDDNDYDESDFDEEANKIDIHEDGGEEKQG